MNYRYFTCDVFTNVRFGGNPLAVLPDATGLDTEQMQQIAREFNFSESAFVFPAEAGGDRRVRIFTPKIEVPFAGHPNIGTAFVLATDGAFGDIGEPRNVTFEEPAGPVSVRIFRDRKGKITCELQAPQPLTLGQTVSPSLVANALSLQDSDIATALHPPQVASVGLPFLIVELRTLDALRRARPNITALEGLRAAGIVPDVHLYVRSSDKYDIRARMFAPLDGALEDPATGSANCALVAMLAELEPTEERERRWHIAQGVEMGRPSELAARSMKSETGTTIWIAGHSVLIGEGTLVLG